MQINKKVVQFFSALSDETRIKILFSLSKGGKSVNEIHNFIGKDKMTLSAISHQLKYLQGVEVIYPEKKGREKIFRLSGDFCWCMLRDAIKHFKEVKNEKS